MAQFVKSPIGAVPKKPSFGVTPTPVAQEAVKPIQAPTTKGMNMEVGQETKRLSDRVIARLTERDRRLKL